MKVITAFVVLCFITACGFELKNDRHSPTLLQLYEKCNFSVQNKHSFNNSDCHLVMKEVASNINNKVQIDDDNLSACLKQNNLGLDSYTLASLYVSALNQKQMVENKFFSENPSWPFYIRPILKNHLNCN